MFCFTFIDIIMLSVFFLLHSIYNNQLLDEVFVISRIIKVEVRVISLIKKRVRELNV